MAYHVAVDDGEKTVLAGFVQHPVYPLEERLVDAVRRIGLRVGRPSNGNPDRVETSVRNDAKVFVGQRHAPRALGGSLQGVAQVNAANGADPAAESRVPHLGTRPTNRLTGSP